jgi:hypothetical protein
MWWESPRAQLGLLVDASALPMHLSLSLSLSCPSGSPGLTAETRRAANPLGGRIDCCHARGDVLRPRGVASDRTPAYKAANGRQAHCERSCRTRGGVAGTSCASFSHSPCRGRHALTRRVLATESCALRGWWRSCFKGLRLSCGVARVSGFQACARAWRFRRVRVRCWQQDRRRDDASPRGRSPRC